LSDLTKSDEAVIETNLSEQDKQKGDLLAPLVQDTQGKPDETNPGSNPANALTLFEKQSLVESRKMRWITLGAFLAALVGAFFIALQFIGLTHQTQILSAQAISAVASSIAGELNTRQQLAIAQQQANAAQVAAEAARKQAVSVQYQLEAADRPWISVDVSINSPLTYDSNGVHLSFAFVPKNLGRSPAQNIYISPRLVPAFMGDDLREIQKRICKPLAAQDRTTNFPGYILFPGDHYIQEITIGMSIEELNSRYSKWKLSQGMNELIPIALVGCVDYTFESSQRHHQTGFVFEVLMRAGGLVLRSKTPLAPESLMLIRHFPGGYFAN
jgi:hypothetical protein